MWHWYRLVATVLLAVAVVVVGAQAHAADDPYLEWLTLRTPHARVHFYRGCEPIARRVADFIEHLHARLARELGWSPTEVTEVVLTDNTDDANGAATAIPYNFVRLYITAPDDMSVLSDYDDWYLTLVSHEYTHIFHTDNITGAPAVVNAVLGKTLAPNQVQPRWVLEGLATLNESRHTSAGRIRSTLFDMFMRADVLEDRIVPLDQMSNSPRRWPQGTIWYLYGSRFVWWLTETYGFDVQRAIARDTGAQLVPWGMNRIARRVTGRTYEELYEGWCAYLRKHYGEQLQRVRIGGLREGVQLTHHGQWVARPRFVPPAARTTDGYAEVLYYLDDGHDRPGFYRLVLRTATDAKPGASALVARTSGNGGESFAPDGSLYFNSTEIWKRVYPFNDILRLPPRTTALSGLEPVRQRLTFGHRAQEPDVSPDGRHIVFTVNHRGTTYLKIAKLTPEGALSSERTMVPSAAYEQAYTPRFSPDGRLVAYSSWTRGGYRDIRLVDVETGSFEQLTRDRAVDRQPSFSPDGRYVLFSSDRTGIANIYAFDRQTKRLFQVTNVRTGAFYPEVSPDGKTLLYVGYSSYGFDLFVMEFDPRSFRTAPEAFADRPEVAPDPQHVPYEIEPYSPLPSLRPRSFTVDYGPGTWGQALVLRTAASDALGHHTIAGAITVETEESVPYMGLAYAYGRLPFNYSTTIFRSLAPRKGYRVNSAEPVWLETTVGLSSSLSYTQATPFDSQSYSLGYSVARFSGDLPIGSSLDPYASVGEDPIRGLLGVMQGSWRYSNIEQYPFGVGPKRGFTASMFGSAANMYTASQYTLYAFGYDARGYVPMPWLRHHTLALHGSGATGAGDYPRRGLYYVGGFVDVPLLDTLQNSIFQGGYVLRGYRPTSFIGSQFHLFNVEYRFPLLVVDHGLSTLPLFLQRLNGNLFLDYGGSFDQLDVENWRDQFHTGIGAELWAELQLAYYLVMNVRLGYAKGYGVSALPDGQKYVVISAPF